MNISCSQNAVAHIQQSPTGAKLAGFDLENIVHRKVQTGFDFEWLR
jgi:hypothetical protein